jgi:hypothetical protein
MDGYFATGQSGKQGGGGQSPTGAASLFENEWVCRICLHSVPAAMVAIAQTARVTNAIFMMILPFLPG